MSDDQNSAPATNNGGAVPPQRPAVNYFTWLGVVVTLVGAASYFLYFVQFPDLRDFPWVNLPLVALGVIFSAAGLRRAFSSAGYRFLSKALASVGFLFCLGLGSLFCFMIFGLSYQLPDVDGVSQAGDSAPVFSLTDQDNKAVQLADFQGTNLVIAFYRGHW